MKTFTFRYDPHPRKSAMSSIQKSIKTGAIDIDQDSITCKSMDDMMKLMTKSRFQVFAAIVEKTPESLTELANILEKDLGNVLRDAKVLESLGLIKLKKSPGRRGEKVKPFALYQRIVFECEPKKEREAG
jgi:predicted transcriptional regulator